MLTGNFKPHTTHTHTLIHTLADFSSRLAWCVCGARKTRITHYECQIDNRLLYHVKDVISSFYMHLLHPSYPVNEKDVYLKFHWIRNWTVLVVGVGVEISMRWQILNVFKLLILPGRQLIGCGFLFKHYLLYNLIAFLIKLYFVKVQ